MSRRRGRFSEWLITKLWQISPEEISATSQAIQDKIDADVRQRADKN